MAEPQATPVPSILSPESTVPNALLIRLAWVAAFLEGEGWFGKRPSGTPVIVVGQVQRAPLDWLHSMFGGRFYVDPSSSRRKKSAWVWRLMGRQAVRVMMTVYPFMTPKRRDQIRGVLAAWRAQPPAPGYRTRCQRGHARWGRMARPNGQFQRYCMDCDNDRHRAWRLRNPEIDRRYRRLARERRRLSQT
jgi:hypothetical protein